MSKRRASVVAEEGDYNDSMDVIRSIKLNRSVSSFSNLTIDTSNSHIDTVSQALIEQVLTWIYQLTNTIISPNLIRNRASEILQRYPEKEHVKLHYQNQLIEIPITGSYNIMHNEKFPYQREPISISTDVHYFLENLSSFTMFKKVMIKNCRLSIIPESLIYLNKCPVCNNQLEITETDHLHSEQRVNLIPIFQFNCQIISGENTNSILICPVTESTMKLSNILLEKPNLWRAIYDIVLTSSLSTDLRQKVVLQCFNNLFSCFNNMSNVDIAVQVNSNNNVSIMNIFHNYYTA